MDHVKIFLFFCLILMLIKCIREKGKIQERNIICSIKPPGLIETLY